MSEKKVSVEDSSPGTKMVDYKALYEVQRQENEVSAEVIQYDPIQGNTMGKSGNTVGLLWDK